MSRQVHLVLEDGAVFTGESFGAAREAWGEVVFNTTMTGYQEVLTDPSYAGQMVTLTYPLVGNYGINPADFESRRIQAAALIVRQHCDLPSHAASRMTLDAFSAGVRHPRHQRRRHPRHHPAVAYPRRDDGNDYRRQPRCRPPPPRRPAPLRQPGSGQRGDHGVGLRLGQRRG